MAVESASGIVARDITEQKRLEDDLRLAQSYTRALIESSFDALFAVDSELRITDVNEETVRTTGCSREELIGSSFPDYFTDPARAAAGVKQTLAEKLVANYVLVLRSKAGKETQVTFNASVFQDAEGTIHGIFASARDITEQKRLDNDLRLAQSYTRALIESSFDALFAVDPGLRITDVNEETVRTTGYSREELIGSSFPDYFTDPARAAAGVKKTLAEKLVANYVLVLRSKEGEETLVTFNASVFQDTEGTIRGIFASARDITEQRRLQEEIREKNRALTETTAFLNNVLESATGYSIIAKDLEGTVLVWNEGARRNYGYTAEEMVGKRSPRTLHTPEDIDSGRAKWLLDTALRVGKAEGVFERVRKNGKRFTAALSVTLRHDAAGQPVGYVIISKDITEQKQLEEQLQHKNEELEEQNRRVREATRLKSEFLANMSHELRTPLNGIIGFAELMHDGKVGPVSPDHREYLGDILSSSRHLLQLINDVLDLAKVESGKMEFRREQIDVKKLLAETRDILRTLIAEKRIRVEWEVDPSLVSIVADPAKLKQVLYNYLSNALKFTPEEGRVWVRVRPEDEDHFRLEVVDNGIGIGAEDFGRLFIEFQQLDGSTAKKYQGTGLGLALTRRIVEAQGGRVGVSSTPGEGSTFYAVLPRVSQGADSDSAHPLVSIAPRSGQLAVLVVDDDANDRAWLVGTLAAAGYAVTAVATGQAAIRAARERPFDVVTLDLLLPDMTGWDVLRAIRASEANRDVPAIVVSVLAEKGVGLGFVIHDFLVKPVGPADLRKAIGHLRLPANGAGPLLIIDDDRNAAKLMEPTLHELGLDFVAVQDGESGLRSAAEQPPSAVILDLLMPGMNGFEFLRRFRLTPTGRRTPVIVWTVKDLSAAERAQLQSSAQAIIHKGAGSTEALLAELAVHVPPREQSPPEELIEVTV